MAIERQTGIQLTIESTVTNGLGFQGGEVAEVRSEDDIRAEDNMLLLHEQLGLMLGQSIIDYESVARTTPVLSHNRQIALARSFKNFGPWSSPKEMYSEV